MLVRLSIIFTDLTKEAITGANIALENVAIQMDNFSIRVLGCSLVVGMENMTLCLV